MVRRTTVLIGVTAIAVASIGVGYAAARQMSSPAQEAADAAPPEPGPVTVGLERRHLASQVVMRGDAVYDGSIEVRVEVAGLVGPAIVSSPPPAVGETIEEGQAVFEIAGHPVVALDGDLPTYRDLGPGSTGPDVAQLEVALQRLGFDTGTIDDVYDTATSGAVAAMFAELGSAAPAAPAALLASVRAAQDAVDSAIEAVAQSTAALQTARKGPTNSERLAADSAVNAAQRTLIAAQAEGDAAEIATATEQLQIAQAQRAELLAPAETAEQQAAVSAASATLQAANLELWNSTIAAGTPMPAAQIVFIPQLPRRVDVVSVARGELVVGPVMTVSGANVVVRASVTEADDSLVETGMAVQLSTPSGAIAATIDSLESVAAGGSTATITLDDPTTDELESIRGLNVQVTVPIAATDGEVLCAPLAAISAGPGGESRIELVHPDGTSTLVTVTVGLVAEGYAEITTDGEPLAAGDLVVVGR